MNDLNPQPAYGSPESVVARAMDWIGNNGRESTVTLLLYEAVQCIKKLVAAPTPPAVQEAVPAANPADDCRKTCTACVSEMGDPWPCSRAVRTSGEAVPAGDIVLPPADVLHPGEQADSYSAEAVSAAIQADRARRAGSAAALRIAEAALADIGDADREPGDDLAWCERRAVEALPAVRAALATAIPERATGRTAEQQGLFRKFDVRRADGSDQPGGKHHGCRYFVLDVDHDAHAGAALTAYAAACEATHPVLARDLREKWGAAAVPAAQPASTWIPEPGDIIAACLDYSLKRGASVLRATGHSGDAIDASRLEYARVTIAAAPQAGQLSGNSGEVDAEVTNAMIDAYLSAQRAAVEEADKFGRPNIGGLHTNTVRGACKAGLAAAIAAMGKGNRDA